MIKPILISLLLCSLQSVSQTITVPALPGTLNVGGGTATIANNFTIDWSIGESTVINTYFGENNYANSIIGIRWNVTSGILQPFDKNHIVYNFLIPNWTNQEIRLYPVPTHNIVTIDFRSVTTGHMAIQLFDANGTLMGVREFNQVNGNSIQTWDLRNRSAGVYYFHIVLTGANGIILKQGTFKAEKN